MKERPFIKLMLNAQGQVGIFASRSLTADEVQVFLVALPRLRAALQVAQATTLRPQKITGSTSSMTYEEVIQLAEHMQIHNKVVRCKKKFGYYLKFHLKDGVELDGKLGEFYTAIEARVGHMRTFSHNPARRTATVTLYNQE